MTATATVRSMTSDEYAAWSARMVEGYAADMAAASGGTLEEARADAEAQHGELLPDGAGTAGMLLLRVLDGSGRPAGILWLGPHPRRAGAGWVYDIEIDEDRRGEGLGRAAMLAAEQVGHEAGWAAIGLNVFGHNPTARALYDSLGYAVASTVMTKPLSG